MSRLMVRGGKTYRTPAFHPTLRIESTGFCEHQWVGMFWRPGCFPGMECVHNNRDVAKMIAHYLSELKRCNHYVVMKRQP